MTWNIDWPFFLQNNVEKHQMQESHAMIESKMSELKNSVSEVCGVKCEMWNVNLKLVL